MREREREKEGCGQEEVEVALGGPRVRGAGNTRRHVPPAHVLLPLSPQVGLRFPLHPSPPLPRYDMYKHTQRERRRRESKREKKREVQIYRERQHEGMNHFPALNTLVSLEAERSGKMKLETNTNKHPHCQ